MDQHLSRTRAWSSEGEANVGGGGGLAHATLAGGDDSDAEPKSSGLRFYWRARGVVASAREKREERI